MRIGLLLLATVLLTGCSIATDGSTALSKRTILDQVNNALNSGDCVSAVSKIEPLYNSIYTDNEIRLAAASAYACYAQMNFFSYLDDLTQSASGLAGPEFWAFLTREFPSTSPTDKMVEGGLLSIDALLSVLKTGIPILPSSQINPTGFNPGSTQVNDRTTDANSYLTFVSMATIGAIQHRYGSPFANGKKGANLTWTTAATMDATGCAYASAIVNLVDSMGALAQASSTLNTAITNIQTIMQAGVYTACDAGCQNQDLSVPFPGWVQSGCTTTTACATCPTALRDRSACQNLASDQVSCAAAGVINFINFNNIAGWETGP